MSHTNNLVIKKIKDTIKKIDPLATAILFGSRATGHSNKDSDWDVLILTKKAIVSLKDEQLFRHSLYDVELDTGEPISTFVYNLDDWNTKFSSTPLYYSVKKNGVVL